MRAAKAEAAADYLSGDLDTTKWTVDATQKTATAYYDAGKGLMQSNKPNAYGKGTAADGKVAFDGYTNTKPYTTKVIKATVNTETGEITIGWE